MPKKQIAPLHPGEMLREEFMKTNNLTINGLALRLRVPATRIGAIVNEKRGMTADAALRLARYFETSPEFSRRTARAMKSSEPCAPW